MTDDASPADELLQTAQHSRAVDRKDAGDKREDQVIVFEAAQNRWYALPIAAVERTERVSTITPVPRAPDFVRGVASLRGGVVCVVSLPRLLGASEAGDAARSLLVLVYQGRRLAMLSHSVPDFLRVSHDDTLPVPPGGNDVYLHAIERDGDIVGVLSPEKLFDQIERSLGHAG